MRVLSALDAHRVPDWPYSRLALHEIDPETGIEQWHVFDGWRWYGSATTLAEARRLGEGAQPAFDPAVFRLLRQALDAPGRARWRLEAVAL
ncbi:MAG: hypothetical protein R3E48_17415 [Burkholderiaceae bacterium]